MSSATKASPGTLRQRLTWMREGTDRLLWVVDGLDPSSYAEPSSLPGWTIGHIVAHLHHNAVALGRLATWARTGVETPMYASSQQRGAEIEQGATRSPAELAALVRTSATRLDEHLTALTDDMWMRTVVSAQGRRVSADEVPWMRVREVVVHAIDLGGASFNDYPEPLVSILVREIVERRLARKEGPPLAGLLSGRSPEDNTLPAWL